ncbi:hypothetical protein BWL13_02517 [Microbacterium oleivorans]|uniref:hypothetical protein n=1 Tax=Microbacterium oleivorans TaxID=273677 RepID=UPI0009767B49|nr:hypothetical protein [Microbacterium oleivorans]AZS44920.1 hypothetical protein BWL13_02517 [Microbacterium oleivorans]
MSDPKYGERDDQKSEPAYGEPINEPTSPEASRGVDDVVGSANDSLADAEAASRAADDRRRGDAAFDVSDRGSDLSVDYSKYSEPDAPVASSAVTSEPLYRPAAEEPEAVAADAPTRANESVVSEPASQAAPATAVYSHVDETPTTVTSTEPAATATAAPTAVYSQQPIFVQAPEAPRPRGNRGAAGAIGLLAALLFAILYLAATLGLSILNDDLALDALGNRTVEVVTTWGFWVPVAVFFLGFWLLGAFINRGRWGRWVVFGLIVGAIAYGGHILGQLFEAPFWSIAPSRAGEIVGDQLLAPLAVIAFVLGREITIWFGAWVAARGRRVTELNDEAQREYERTLEAGPQLHQY